MFHKATFVALSGLLTVLFLVTCCMWMLSSPPSMRREGLISTEQNKTGVVKEAYLVQADGTCLHEYLCAKNSVFKILKQKDKTQFIENLEGISAVVEDLVTQNGKTIKQIRSFQAQDGIWDYATQHLKAKKASLSIVESQKTGLKPIFQGQAETLDMMLENGKPKFSIEGFKARLNKDKS